MTVSVRFFPIVLMALDLCAAARYGISLDLRHALYWSGAALLTATVTF